MPRSKSPCTPTALLGWFLHSNSFCCWNKILLSLVFQYSSISYSIQEVRIHAYISVFVETSQHLQHSGPHNHSLAHHLPFLPFPSLDALPFGSPLDFPLVSPSHWSRLVSQRSILRVAKQPSILLTGEPLRQGGITNFALRC